MANKDLINPRTGVAVAELVTSNMGLAGGIAGAGFNTVGNIMDSNSEAAELASQLGVRDLGCLCGKSRIIKEYLRNLDNAPVSKLGRYTTSTIGSIAGGAAAGSLIPIPLVGSLGGAIVGGMAGDKAHSAVFGEDTCDTTAMDVAQLYQTRKSSKPVTAGDILFALRGQLTKGQQEKINNAVEASGGNERRLNKALTGLERKFKSPSLRSLARSLEDWTGVRRDANTTVFEYFAGLINKGVSPGVLLLDPRYIHRLPPLHWNSIAHEGRVSRVAARFGNDDLSQIAASMNKHGVTHQAGDGFVQPLPAKHRNRDNANSYIAT